MTLPEQPTSELLPTPPISIEPLYERIHAILTAARTNVVRTVNTEMVRAYWLIGREIVEEQAGKARAAYGGSDRADFVPLTGCVRQGLYGD